MFISLNNGWNNFNNEKVASVCQLRKNKRLGMNRNSFFTFWICNIHIKLKYFSIRKMKTNLPPWTHHQYVLINITSETKCLFFTFFWFLSQHLCMSNWDKFGHNRVSSDRCHSFRPLFIEHSYFFHDPFFILFLIFLQFLFFSLKIFVLSFTFHANNQFKY